MMYDDQPEHAAQESTQESIQEGITEASFTDSVASDASPKSACTALVPVAEVTQWSPHRPLPRPDAIFAAHLIANLEQAPQSRSLRRAMASDANAAYTANRHRLAGAGLRARQIV